MSDLPQLLHTVIDGPDPRVLAEFYRDLLGLQYRAGDEPGGAADQEEGGPDWLVLTRVDGSRVLAFQRDEDHVTTTWPAGQVPMQLHLDMTVRDVDALHEQRQRAIDLGATEVLDRADDEGEPLVVLADPAGHPFCLFVP